MKRNNSIFTITLCCTFLVAVLDSRHCFSAAAEAVEMCIKNLIPSLFPLLFLSLLICRQLQSISFFPMKWLAKLCGVPDGQESLLLMGLVGGYPVGAQAIQRAYTNGNISIDDGRRLLGFCNNAGPAFIFGMCSCLFNSKWVPWLVWLIHILSALFVGILTRKEPHSAKRSVEKSSADLSADITQAVKTMAIICAWVVLFRILISFLERWFLWSLPITLRIGLSGVTELANGILLLRQISGESLRFLFLSVFLSLGGICVYMQTAAVASSIPIKNYISGKLLQSVISFVLSNFAVIAIFDDEKMSFICTILTVIAALSLIIWTVFKNKAGNCAKCVV